MKYTNIFELIKLNKWNEINNHLLKNPDTDINIKDENDNYLLTYAIIQNQIETIKLLLQNNATVDILDSDGRSVLYHPIKYNYYETFSLLLNSKTIGIPIVDLKDKNNNLPIHYAIPTKNIKIITDLLTHNSNLLNLNQEGYNSLHLAVLTKNPNICSLILKSNPATINSLTSSKENSLHLSCSNKLTEISLLLLSHKINPNQQDHNDTTPLLISVMENNHKLTKILLDNNADINIQDSFGNTPLHYSIIEENFHILDLLLLQKSHINFNLYNIYNKLPIHLILELKNKHPLQDFIPPSNLNFQNNNGNTPLHLLLQSPEKIWKEYSSLLSHKKMNISILNKKNKRPIDYITDKNELQEFTTLLVSAYSNILQTSSSWIHDWENTCSKTSCSDIIHKKITSIINKKSSEISYPIKNKKLNLLPSIKTPPNFSNFTGNIIDILFGLIYLLKTHSNTCSIFKDEINFQIIWNGSTLTLSQNFHKYFSTCIDNSTKRFIIIPIGIEINEGNHSGYLLYDKNKNELERFEPYGSTSLNYDYNSTLLDENIANLFPKITYFSPSSFIPKVSFQYLDSIENNMKNINDPFGFCALWSVWYVDKRLTFYDIDRKSLIKKLIKQIKLSNESFKNLIRNYSNNITSLRDKTFQKANTNITSWLNDIYTDEQYSKLMKLILNMINEIQ